MLYRFGASPARRAIRFVYFFDSFEVFVKRNLIYRFSDSHSNAYLLLGQQAVIRLQDRDDLIPESSYVSVASVPHMYSDDGYQSW
jgi:hypothetical protein